MILVKTSTHPRTVSGFLRWFHGQARVAGMWGVSFWAYQKWIFNEKIPSKYWLYISESIAASKLVNEETNMPVTKYLDNPLAVLLFLAETTKGRHYPSINYDGRLFPADSPVYQTHKLKKYPEVKRRQAGGANES